MGDHSVEKLVYGFPANYTAQGHSGAGSAVASISGNHNFPTPQRISRISLFGSGSTSVDGYSSAPSQSCTIMFTITHAGGVTTLASGGYSATLESSTIYLNVTSIAYSITAVSSSDHDQYSTATMSYFNTYNTTNQYIDYGGII